MPAPSTSTAAPGTAPTKSSFSRPTWPALVAIVIRIARVSSVRSWPRSAAQADDAGKPPVATGPHLVGVMRSSDLPWSSMA